MNSNTHVVRFFGGLGNQLFQYALYESFRRRGYDVYADLADFEQENELRSFRLDKLGVNLRSASKSDIDRLYCSKRNGIKGALIRKYGKKTYYRLHELIYLPDILNVPEGYFDGYWQNYKYFDEYKESIINSIHFPNLEGDKLYNQICEDPYSVSIHVRMGDYLDNEDIYGGICTKDYYRCAMDYISNAIINNNSAIPTFYVFSDDIKRAKEVIGSSTNSIVYVSDYSNRQEYDDMHMMSKCKHHIIANSTFSWWAAFLGQSDETITIAPAIWIKKIKSKDIIPEDWIRI